MKRLQLLVLVCGLMLSSWCLGQETPYIEGDLIIMLNPGEQPDKILEDFQTLNGENTELTYTKNLSQLSNIHLFQFNHQTSDGAQLLESIRKSSLVKAAQFNHIVEDRAVPNDPGFSSQWHHIDASDNDIDTDLAWDITTGGQSFNGDDIVVCVLEGNGSNYNHTDLIANHWTNTAEIDGNGIDDDGNGYVDDINGWNTTAGNDGIGAGGHGTSVSGMVGARGNNSNGGAGVNWNVKIMQVDMGSLTEANVIAAYAYPHTLRDMWNTSGGSNGAFVVATNASWGIDNANPASYPVWCAYYDDLGASGILNCGATTNNNVNIDVNGDMPTGCSSTYMVSVTATNSSDVRTFSGYGTTGVDLAAPGEDVYLPSGSSTYGFTSGTSFASPCVAGAIALLYSAPSPTLANLALTNPQAAADLVRDAILNGVDPVPNLASEVATGGRLNVFNSLNLILAGDCAQWYLPSTVGAGPAIFSCTQPAGYYLADQDCVQSVVDADPFCVDNNWDTVCQAAYDCCTSSQWYLPVDYSTSGSEPAVYDCTAPAGYVLAANQDCVQQIVDNDPWCSDTDWDGICQSSYDCCVNAQWYIPSVVGDGPAVLDCSAPAGYILADQDCAQSVIDDDPFCIDNSWDSVCQAAYDCCLTGSWYIPADYASSASAPALWDCTAPPGYILADQACAQAVIDADSYCIDVDWDSLCQEAYDCCANPPWYIPATPGDGPAIATCDPPAGYVLADQDCAQSVIDDDPFCVDTSWDSLCQEAYDCCLSPPWYIPATPGTGPAIATCDPPADYILADQACAQAVIDDDPFCVDTNWDSLCQDAYDCCLSPPWYIPATPGDGPAIATCDPPAGYILADQDCAQAVIDDDPFCVDTNWDSLCQEAYDCCLSPPWYIPATPGTGPAIATCEPPAGYILADQACAQQVIDDDPFCVETSWDNLCNAAYSCCTGIGTSCHDFSACNYDPTLCEDASTCVYPGCTDSAACNYDATAGCDDGSCTYPQWYIPSTVGDGPAVSACSAPAGYILADQACAQQVIDDDPFCLDTSWDSLCQNAYNCCIGGPVGCTDSTACNYDPSATCDDLSCTYDCSCPGDYDNNGVINAADLLFFLSEFGCTSGCTADLDGDGAVAASDLLMFLSVFGSFCSE